MSEKVMSDTNRFAFKNRLDEINNSFYSIYKRVSPIINKMPNTFSVMRDFSWDYLTISDCRSIRKDLLFLERSTCS